VTNCTPFFVFKKKHGPMNPKFVTPHQTHMHYEEAVVANALKFPLSNSENSVCWCIGYSRTRTSVARELCPLDHRGGPDAQLPCYFLPRHDRLVFAPPPCCMNGNLDPCAGLSSESNRPYPGWTPSTHEWLPQPQCSVAIHCTHCLVDSFSMRKHIPKFHFQNCMVLLITVRNFWYKLK
jgi:hypothetical protein